MARSAFWVIVGCVLMGSITSWAAPPRNSENACLLLREERSWYKHVVRAEKRWDVDAATILSVIYQESAFRALARPARKKIFFFVPVGPKSTAYGYAQVKDETWREYRQRANRPYANRGRFRDATDFVGYYLDWISKNGNIPKNRVKSLYLAYHEGLGGYKSGTWKSKPWLLESAAKVEARTKRYLKQLLTCNVGPAKRYRKTRKRR